MTETEFIIVKTTFPDKASAQAMAKSLIEDKVVACAQIIGPIESHYFWDGDTQVEEEFILLLKTTEKQKQTVVTSLTDQHPYDTPEIIVLPILDGSKGYLDWIAKQTTTSSLA